MVCAPPSTSRSTVRSTEYELPAATPLAEVPAVAITRARPSSASTIAVRSNGTSPRSSRMNALKASSRSSDELSARGAPASGVEHVAVPPELVAKRLGLVGAGRRARSLRGELLDERADEDGHQERDPELE